MSIKAVPFTEYVEHSISKKVDGSWCWSEVLISADEILIVLPDPGLRDSTELKAWAANIKWSDIFEYDEAKPWLNRWTGVAFVDDVVLSMLNKATYRSGRDSIDYLVADFKLAVIVANAETVIRWKEPLCE